MCKLFIQVFKYTLFARNSHHFYKMLSKIEKKKTVKSVLCFYTVTSAVNHINSKQHVQITDNRELLTLHGQCNMFNDIAG